MKCRQCDHDNRADARFCLACGAPLTLVCSCGRELPPDAAFCDACGTRVATDSLPDAVVRDDSTEQVRAISATLADQYQTQGDVNAVFDDLREAVRRADRIGEVGLRLLTRHDAIPVAQVADLELALRYIDEALRLLEAEDSELGSELLGIPPTLLFLWHSVFSAVESGRLEEAVDATARIRALIAADPNPDHLPFAATAASRCEWLVGEYERAAEAAREPASAGGEPATSAMQVALRRVLGDALLGSGEFKQAAQCLEEGIEIVARAGAAVFMRPTLLSTLALAKVGLGETGRAVELAREALSLSIERGMRAIEASQRITLGFALLADLGVDSRAAVEAELAKLSELGDEGRLSGVDACRAIELRAALAKALGETGAASVLLRSLRARYQSMGATGRVAQLAEELRASS